MGERLREKHPIDKPREKLFRYGPARLSDTELLAILLGSGTRSTDVLAIAHEITARFSLQDLQQADLEELQDIGGVGKAKSAVLCAATELGKRIDSSYQPEIISPKEVWQQMVRERSANKEHFVVFYLSVRNVLIARETITVGTLDSSIIHPREVFEPAIRNCSAKIILSHNHPSGFVSPSDEDIHVTKRIFMAGTIMGITLVDHVIVTQSAYYSFVEEGMLTATEV